MGDSEWRGAWLCRCVFVSSFHVLYPNACGDCCQSSPATCWLTGSQEKGWPLGCLAKGRAPAGSHFCLFETQTWLKRRKEKKCSLLMYKSVLISTLFIVSVFKFCSWMLKWWRQQMNRKTKAVCKVCKYESEFVHTRQLHTHRTGNCICKLAFGLCNKLLSITPSFYWLWSRGNNGD